MISGTPDVEGIYEAVRPVKAQDMVMMVICEGRRLDVTVGRVRVVRPGVGMEGEYAVLGVEEGRVEVEWRREEV